MNIRFISEERIKKATSIVVAGTIALTSVVGLTGCGSDDLRKAIFLTLKNGEKIIVKERPDHHYHIHYRDLLSDAIYCIENEPCDEIHIKVETINSISSVLTKEELLRDKWTEEEIVEIYKRINSEDKNTSLTNSKVRSLV